MKILSATFVGYRGFRLRQIQHFVYRPVQKTQVILGTNGSGKSSLMRELSPLPAQHSDYTRPGRKEIEYQHNGHHYLLQSLFEPEGNRYPFLMDGENLNPGYTVTVYKELVKQHFGYTPEIHAVLTGEVRFHAMSVNERRNWFTQISETDYSYAIKYYKRLKEKVRDLQGALKLNQARLTQELEKCLSEEAEVQLRTSVQHLTTMLNTMLDHRKPRLQDGDALAAQLNQRDQQVFSQLEQLEQLVIGLSEAPGLSRPEQLSMEQIELQGLQQALQRELTHWCEISEQLQKDYEAASLSSASSLEDVQASIRTLEESESQLLSQIKLPLHFPQPSVAESAVQSLRPLLEDLLPRWSACPRRDYQRETYETLLRSRPSLETALKHAQAVEAEAFKEKQTLELHKAKGETACPKCDHRWTPGYDDHCYQKALRTHQEALRCVEDRESKLTSLNKEINEHETFFELSGQFLRITQHYAVLRPFWDYAVQRPEFQEDPSVLLYSLQTLGTDLIYHTKLTVVKQQLAEQRKLEALMQNTKQLDKQKLETQIQIVQEKIQAAQAKDRAAHQRLQAGKQQLSTWMAIQTLRSRIMDAFGSRQADYRRLLEDRCVGALDEIIRHTKLNLSQQQWTLSQLDIQRGVVAGLKAQILDQDAQLKVLKLAMKALSPSEGLIAKGMTNFINHFLAQMNVFISKIWLYPLALLPIEMDEDSLDLDYRFPVSVNNDAIPSPDVAKTSAGQQEVLDLAFVAVSMRYLGLHHAPIFLDEFARTFDVAHRQMAYQVIDHLIDSTDYSQVFLVSHYQDGYASLNAAEILVLCDSNIKLPSHLAYNKHVEIH